MKMNTWKKYPITDAPGGSKQKVHNPAHKIKQVYPANHLRET